LLNKSQICEFIIGLDFPLQVVSSYCRASCLDSVSFDGCPEDLDLSLCGLSAARWLFHLVWFNEDH